MPPTAQLERPARPSQPAVRHLPRRETTATTVLRALETRPLPAIPDPGPTDHPNGDPADAAHRASPADAAPTAEGEQDAPAAHVRALRLRDIATGGAAAAGSWALAAHLGVLGTAGGMFLVSCVSTVLVAFATDSVQDSRRILRRALGGVRRSVRHRSRR